MEEPDWIDKLFRSKLKAREFHADDASWQEALNLIEQAEGAAKFRKWGYGLSSVIILGAISLFVWNSDMNDKESSSNPIANESTLVQEEIDAKENPHNNKVSSNAQSDTNTLYKVHTAGGFDEVSSIAPTDTSETQTHTLVKERANALTDNNNRSVQDKRASSDYHSMEEQSPPAVRNIEPAKSEGSNSEGKVYLTQESPRSTAETSEVTIIRDQPLDSPDIDNKLVTLPTKSDTLSGAPIAMGLESTPPTSANAKIEPAKSKGSNSKEKVSVTQESSRSTADTPDMITTRDQPLGSTDIDNKLVTLPTKSDTLSGPPIAMDLESTPPTSGNTKHASTHTSDNGSTTDTTLNKQAEGSNTKDLPERTSTKRSDHLPATEPETTISNITGENTGALPTQSTVDSSMHSETSKITAVGIENTSEVEQVDTTTIVSVQDSLLSSPVSTSESPTLLFDPPTSAKHFLHASFGIQGSRQTITGTGAANIVENGISSTLAPSIALEYFQQVGRFHVGSGLHYTVSRSELDIPDRINTTTLITDSIIQRVDSIFTQDSTMNGGLWTTVVLTDTVQNTLVNRSNLNGLKTVLIQSHVRIPLLLAYRTRFNRITVGIDLGPTVNILTGQRGLYPTTDLSANTSIPTEQFRRVSIGYMLRPSIHYTLSDRFSIGIEPHLYGQFQGSTDIGILQNQRSMNYGIGLGFVYGLLKPEATITP